MRVVSLALAALAGTAAITASGRAAEPAGCTAFKWSIDRELAVLRAAPAQRVASDATVAANGTAIAIALQPAAQAALPMPPERAGKGETFAGFVRVAAPAAGVYRVSLSGGAWIDAIQGEHYLKPTAFSGATGCDGIRKSVKFTLAASPLLLQFSGVSTGTISVVIAPDEP